jgi:chromosome segregation ATPase
MNVDEVLAKRLERVEQRLNALEQRAATMATAEQVEALGAQLGSRMDNLENRIDKLKGELIDHTRQVELRLATAVHGVLTAVNDLKTWHEERDDLRAKMRELERRLAEIETRTST